MQEPLLPMQSLRSYSFFDRICLSIDQGLRALNGTPQTTGAPYPGKSEVNPELSAEQRKHSAGLMRVNHAGEVCAQALYHGQGLVSKEPVVQEKMQHAAIEEGDHLSWCKKRLEELDSHTSYLNPFWYTGSFCMGMAAGMIGDKWSLGFLAETERQVIKHLSCHMHLLPREDLRSYTILKKMEEDEARHRDEAVSLGAHELPWIVRKAMSLTSKIMVKTAYWI
jgi:3-demethoxyubiquinol 3-hydroxylase